MKRTVAALLAAVLVSLPAFAQFAKPTAEITKFRVEAISLRDVTFLFELTVKNPYPLGLEFSGMTLDFSVEGSKVFTAAGKGGFSVGARGSKAQAFTVTLAYEAIAKLVKDYASKDYLATVIDGTLAIPLPKIPGLPKDISFSYRLEKKIPAIKPRLAVTGFTVTPPSAEEVAKALAKAGKKADASQARSAIADLLAGRKPPAAVVDPAELDVPLRVSFTIEVANEAKAPLGFAKLGYELFVNGESLVAGESSEVRREGNRTFVTVTSVFSAKKLSKGVKALFADRKGSFRVVGAAALQLPAEIRSDPVPLAFDEGGSFSLK